MTNTKVLFGALSIILAANASIASAQTTSQVSEPAILFKVYDVQPVTDNDGTISACDYSVTFYNRTNNAISGASVDLVWEDETAKNLSNNEETKSSRSAANPNVISSIEVPAIASMKQIELRTKVKTDRCFLLLENVNIRVKSCSTVASQPQTRSSGRDAIRERNSSGAAGCGGLFKFVSPTSPEYYQEFAPVSLADEKEQKNTERQQVQQQINDEYAATVAEFEKASLLLQEIK